MTAVAGLLSKARSRIGLIILVTFVLVVVGLWWFDPFGCDSDWRVVTYEDFSGQVTENCVDSGL